MEKIRISQIAKEIGKTSKEILQKAQELGFEATRGIDVMCRDSWNWQSKNPNGYR